MEVAVAVLFPGSASDISGQDGRRVGAVSEGNEGRIDGMQTFQYRHGQCRFATSSC